MDDVILIWAYLGIIALAIKVYLHIRLKFPDSKGWGTILKYRAMYFSLGYIFPISTKGVPISLVKKVKIANGLIFFFYINLLVLFVLIKINFSTP